MVEESHSTDVGMRLQTLQPKLRLGVVGFYIFCIAFLGYLGYTKPGVYRAFYGGLSGIAAAALIVQYRRERVLADCRLSAVGVVTEHKVRFKGAPYLRKGAPLMKYEFVAFDQKTYHGETGWGAGGLAEGEYVTVLYNPDNPAANHPLSSFIFYRFQ
jgi:hypothetical protein